MADNNIYKTATGSTDSQGKAIYDVFEGTRKLELPEFQQRGLNIDLLPIGQTPQGFQSQFLPVKTGDNSGVVSDTSGIRTQVDNMANDIKYGLSQYGINPPEDKISGTIQGILDDINARRDQVANRESTDISNIGKSYSNAEEQLKATQADELAKAEGRTRIGGFLTRMEVEDIQKLQRQQSLDMAAMEGQKQNALLAARRAYEDQDYKLAQDYMDMAKDIEGQKYQKQQDYFKSIQEYNQMQTPISRANEAVQKLVLDWMSKYPDAFGDVKPSDLINMSTNEAYNRVLNSNSYQEQLNTPTDFSIQDVNGYKIRYGFDANGNIVSKVNLGKATSGGGDGNFTSTQFNSGASNAGVSIETFRTYDEDTKNFFINGAGNAKKIIDDNILAGASNQELHDDINGQETSATIKNYLSKYVDAKLPPELEEKTKDKNVWMPSGESLWNKVVNWWNS